MEAKKNTPPTNGDNITCLHTSVQTQIPWTFVGPCVKVSTTRCGFNLDKIVSTLDAHYHQKINGLLL